MSNWYSMGPVNTSVDAFKRDKHGVFKASNVWFNPATMEATSFAWWYFVKRIGGKVVFNDYSYSSYTTRHQRKVQSAMKSLGIKVDVVIQARRGLQDLPQALRDYEERVKTLLALVAKPGTRAAKNAERVEEVKRLQVKMQHVKKLIKAEERTYA